MRFGVVSSSYPIQEIVESGILAEKYGFNSVWVPDHFTDIYPAGDKVDPWTVLATIGSKTKTIELASIVTDVQRTHPARTAHIVATLDELTGGRAILGIGAGEAMNTLPYGLPFESPNQRLKRLDEAIRVIRLLWKSQRSSRADFNGEFYKLSGAVLDQKPVRMPAPPIYVGVLGARRGLQLTGELGDGWIPWTNTPETYAKRSREIRQSAGKIHRGFEEMDMGNVTSVALTTDSKLERAAINSMKMEILVTTHRDVLKRLGFTVPASPDFDYTYQRTLAEEKTGDRAAEIAKDMPDELVRKFLIVGNVAEVIEGLARFADSGVRHAVIKDVIGMSLVGKVGETEKTLKAFGEKVIPYFKSN